ncbi:MAG: hypothetical protein P8J87_14155 [Verrucomicrobiales bacterium]|nr:hypothetical protein [Verrucomicrobiales bacterium]
MLVEMVWRMIRWQPGYLALRKWMLVLGDATRSAAVSKKAIVAAARSWRWTCGGSSRDRPAAKI